MIRLLALTLALTSTLLVAAAPSEAADECKGLQRCIPVEGPWVAIPSPGGLDLTTTWKLDCPQGIVAGTDARVSDKKIDVEFAGRVGSPVNPGITTTGSALFRGTYAGVARTLTAYRPFIGCIPTAGGGPRTRVSFQQQTEIKPGTPITVRATSMTVRVGSLARVSLSCKPKERLLGSSTSFGLYTGDLPPTRQQLAAVHVIRARRGNKILVSATRRGNLPSAIRVEVQVQAVCAT